MKASVLMKKLQDIVLAEASLDDWETDNDSLRNAVNFVFLSEKFIDGSIEDQRIHVRGLLSLWLLDLFTNAKDINVNSDSLDQNDWVGIGGVTDDVYLKTVKRLLIRDDYLDPGSINEILYAHGVIAGDIHMLFRTSIAIFDLLQNKCIDSVNPYDAIWLCDQVTGQLEKTKVPLTEDILNQYVNMFRFIFAIRIKDET